MMTRHRPSAILAAALAIYYLILIVLCARTDPENRRNLTLFNLGSQTSSIAGMVRPDGDALAIMADDGSAEASWSSYSYEVGHLASHARICDMSVAIVGSGLTGASASASTDILVNGDVLRHVTFSSARSGIFPFASRRLVPANLEPQSIEIVPLDSEFGFVIPVPARYCSIGRLSVGVRVKGGTWAITRAGVILRYVPARAAVTTFGGASFVAAGIALLVLLCACLFVTLRRMSGLGRLALTPALVLLILAPLTYDQWDFRLWLAFSEVTSFGGGDAANLWYGSPLWTFVPSLFSTITAASYAMTGSGDQAMTAILMKVALGLAYCYTAYEIGMRAPATMRSRYILVALLVPVGLYELAAGYREIFATALVVASLTTASHRRPIVSTILAVVAASISEELLPFVLFPAAVELLGARSRARAALALVLGAAGIGLFLSEWKFLVPHELAANAIAYRFGVAPLGGASWAGALDGLRLLPSWLPARAPFFSAGLFLIVALVPATRFVRIFRDRTAATWEATFDGTSGVFVALVAAFLVAFRGTDPNLWYSLTALVFWYFATVDALNPFPLVLGSIEGLAFYATVGFRDFVNQRFFWPVDEGLLGILSTERFALDLTATGLIVAFLLSVSRGSSLDLFSRRSPYLLLLFFSAVAATATAAYALDVVLCTAAVACVTIVFVGGIVDETRYRRLRANPLFQSIVICALVSVDVLFGTRNGAATIGASSAMLLAARSRFGSCDVVLGAGAIVVLSSQTGTGPISTIGWVAFAVTAIAIVTRVARDSRRD